MSLNTLRAAGFDAVIDFDDVTSYERFKLLADLRATSVIGFNKEPYKLYDHSIAFFDGNSHISLRYKQVVKLFGIVDDRPYHYHLPGCRHEREKVARLLSQAGEVELRIAINPFTASEDKDFCHHQVATLVERLHALPYRVCIVMVGRSEKIRRFQPVQQAVSAGAGDVFVVDLHKFGVIVLHTNLTAPCRPECPSGSSAPPRSG